jgi:hypothetical protein
MSLIMAHSGSAPDDFETRSSSRIGLEEFAKLLARKLGTESATRELLVDCTLSDFASRRAREQSPRLRTASVTVGNVLRQQVHPVLFGTHPSNCDPHRSLFQTVMLEGCQMDWATLTVQTAICDHGIHFWLFAAAGHGTYSFNNATLPSPRAGRMDARGRSSALSLRQKFKTLCPFFWI